ncbi:helix-turn-helix domain-containing protein [Streptosporangium subroseum]|uniref:helix-turn-helix domain-containing protein n=1 Tax=Streptosporangium subroseum TaxID=106412 RepID=UPI003084944C|nr:helix-turn-helix domain-containing protein [Streptosporangium subroseum]
MMAGSTPTLRRRQLASRLRELRESAGLSIKEAADGIECSPAKISRIETAQRGAIPRDVRDLCVLYGITDQTKIGELMEMAREAKQPGLIQEYGLTAAEDKVRDYINIETTATSISEFQTAFLPGLLQTEDYARALIRAMLPRMTQEVLESRTQARMKRQEILRKQDPPQYWAVFDEAVLLRPVGDGHTMRQQLNLLIEVAGLPNVTIQVVPLSIGPYMGLDNSFVLFNIPDLPTPDIIYIENLTTVNYLEKPTDIAPYREAIDRLRAVALDPRASMALIVQIRDSFEIDG